jgi:hypothetical protein
MVSTRGETLVPAASCRAPARPLEPKPPALPSRDTSSHDRGLLVKIYFRLNKHGQFAPH